MNDDNNQAGLEPVDMPVDGSTNWTPPSYDIPEEDRAIADEILAMDALALPGPGTIKGEIKIGPLKATALPPSLRSSVERQLADMRPDMRAEAEPRLVREAIEGERPRLRMQSGLGPDALPHHREQAEIAREFADAAAEFNRNTELLAAVDHYDVGIDPETGHPKPQEVLRVTGNRRKALIAQQEQLSYRMSLLSADDGEHGPEARRRLAKALRESVEIKKARDARFAEEADAKRMAADILREERVKARAEAIAKHQRTTL